MKKIFTAGYSGHLQRSLVLAAREMDALVLDIRLKPQTQYAGFDKKSLLLALDSRYFHVHDLGNVNHADPAKGIQLVNRIRGVNWAMKLVKEHNLILLCGCKDFHTCHRKTVSAALRACGAQVSELQWPEVPRLDLAALPDVALSVKQPWAWLLLRPDVTEAEERRALYRYREIKDIENRTWPTDFRGRFLIHASQSVDVEGHMELMQNATWRKLIPKLGDLDKGGIVGIATLEDVLQSSSSRWFIGPHGFRINAAKPLTFKELRGARGFFSVSEQLEAMKQTRLKAA